VKIAVFARFTGVNAPDALRGVIISARKYLLSEENQNGK